MIRILACVCLAVCLTGSAPVQSAGKQTKSDRKVGVKYKTQQPGFAPKNVGRSKTGASKDCCETKSAFEIINDKEPNITITRNVVELDEGGKERSRETVLKTTTDDNESIDPTNGDVITAHWNSDRLIINVASGNKRFPRNIEFRTLSKDGKTMTVELYVGRVEGQPVVIEVFERSNN